MANTDCEHRRSQPGRHCWDCGDYIPTFAEGIAIAEQALGQPLPANIIQTLTSHA